MDFYVQHFVCVPSLSSQLLLRISPHILAFIPIPPMSLSSRSRSIFNTFRYILPCVAPVCDGMHYHKTGVPWQINNTFIIVLFLLVLTRNALFCKGFRGLINVCFCWHLGKIRQDKACYYYLLVVKMVVKRKRLLLRIFPSFFYFFHF